MSEENGGPAFPQSKRVNEQFMNKYGEGCTQIVTLQQGGLTIRDYFIAAALASPASSEMECGTTRSLKERAEWCVAQADEILKARKL